MSFHHVIRDDLLLGCKFLLDPHMIKPTTLSTSTFKIILELARLDNTEIPTVDIKSAFLQATMPDDVEPPCVLSARELKCAGGLFSEFHMIMNLSISPFEDKIWLLQSKIRYLKEMLFVTPSSLVKDTLKDFEASLKQLTNEA